MIHTSRQLKTLVRNLSKGDNMQAQILIRNYIMERFLERLSLSPYQGNFILKGGILVSAMVGIDTRSTMDIDATIKNLPLSVESAESILAEIISIPIDDGVLFKMERISEIMDEAEYSGIRASMMAFIDTMRTPLKLDISTGDRITCAHRNSQAAVSKGTETLHKVRESAEMQNLWTAYQQKFSYAEGISWEAVMDAVYALSEICISAF